MSATTYRRGIATLADIKARSAVDPVTHCWHWQCAKSRDGTPRMHVFDHLVGDKRVLSGPAGVWNLAHGGSPWPKLVYRCCGTKDCVNPAHMRLAADKAELGLHIARSGRRKGTALESRRANIRKAHDVTGRHATPDEVAAAILSASRSVTGRALAKHYGISEQVVSRIRTGQSHQHLQQGAGA